MFIDTAVKNKTGISPVTCALAVLLLLPTVAAADTLTVLNKAGATASLIDLDSGAVVATLPTGNGPHEAAASPDGALVIAANYGTRGKPGNTLTLIDVARASVVKTIDLGKYSRPHGVQWLADGKRAVVTAEDNEALLIVDVDAGRVTEVIETGQKVSHMVAVAPDGSRAFVANIGSGTVTAIDLDRAKRLANVVTGDGAEGIDITPDGREVWVTNRAQDTVSIIDAKTLEIRQTVESAAFPIRARMTPDGRRVLVSNARSADVTVFDTATRKELHRISMQAGVVDSEGKLFGDQFGGSSIPIGVVMDPAGSRAWVALAGADLIVELDASTWSISRILQAGREPDGMSYSPVSVGAEPYRRPPAGSNLMMRAPVTVVDGLEVIISDVVIPPNATVPRHYHPGEEFLYVIEGSAVHVEEGKPDRVLEAGDTYVIPPRAIHAPRAGPDGARAVVFRLHVQGKDERTLVPDS